MQQRGNVWVDGYKGICLAPVKVHSDPGLVEKRVEELLRQASYADLVDGPLELGDIAVVRYRVEMADGLRFDEARAEVELGSGEHLAFFEDALCGHWVGETFDMDVVLPSWCLDSEIAGKSAAVHVAVMSAKRSSGYSSDDSYVAAVSEFSSYDELADEVSLLIDEENKAEEQRFIRMQIEAALVERTQVEGLEGLLAQRYHAVFGTDLPEEGERNSECEALVGALRDDIVIEAAVDWIAQQEGIEADESDIASLAPLFADANDLSPEKACMLVDDPDVRGFLKGMAMRNKVYDLILSECVMEAGDTDGR